MTGSHHFDTAIRVCPQPRDRVNISFCRSLRNRRNIETQRGKPISYFLCICSYIQIQQKSWRKPRGFSDCLPLLSSGAVYHTVAVNCISLVIVGTPLVLSSCHHKKIPLFKNFIIFLNISPFSLLVRRQYIRPEIPNPFCFVKCNWHEAKDTKLVDKENTMLQPRLSPCTFLCLLIISFLPFHDCFCPTKSVRLTQQGSILSAKYSEDYEDDDEDDYIPDVDVKNFKPPKTSATFGFNKGRSSPSIRKAMGVSGKSSAKGKGWCVGRKFFLIVRHKANQSSINNYYSICLYKLWNRVGSMERKMPNM